MSIFINPEVPEHTHTKLDNSLEIDRQLIISNVTDSQRSWLRRDDANTYILADRDGNGNWESPSPLRLNHNDNQGFVFDHLVHTKENLPVESGSFTPQLITNVTRVEPTYASQSGQYRRQGSFCLFNIYIEVSSVLTGDELIFIEGLPFSSQSLIQSSSYPVFVAYPRSWNTLSDFQIKANIPQGTNRIEVYQESLNRVSYRLREGALNPDSSITVGGTYAV